MREKTIKSESIFEGRVFHVKRDDIELENGAKSFREIILHNGGSSIVALNDKNELFLVRQYRYATGEELYEIPAGKLEAGEDAKDCAARELIEETGYEAKKVEHLITFYPTPGYSSESIRVYKATDLHFVGQHLDEGEFLDVLTVSIDEALNMISDGRIKDGKTVVGILMVANNMSQRL